MKLRLRSLRLWGGLIGLAALGWAQRGPILYSPANEVSIHGTVNEVLTARRGNMAGIHLKVKAQDEAGKERTFDVRLGPAWFIANRNFSFAKGDEIDVTGAGLPDKNGDIILAREVKKGGSTLILRDQQGFPIWSGARGRQTGG